MIELKRYFELQQQIYDYFGYVEDWRVIPLDDATEYYWRLFGEGPGFVIFADTEDKLKSDGDYYRSEIYTQRFLPKWVYRGADYTMICVDTRTDGNTFLQVFSNVLERTEA